MAASTATMRPVVYGGGGDAMPIGARRVRRSSIAAAGGDADYQQHLLDLYYLDRNKINAVLDHQRRDYDRVSTDARHLRAENQLELEKKGYEQLSVAYSSGTSFLLVQILLLLPSFTCINSSHSTQFGRKFLPNLAPGKRHSAKRPRCQAENRILCPLFRWRSSLVASTQHAR